MVGGEGGEPGMCETELEEMCWRCAVILGNENYSFKQWLE